MPLNYIAQDYRHDLSVFYQGDEVPKHGPFWMLCGRSMGNLFEPQNRIQFNSPSDFLCCLYELNLIDQGIFNYYPALHIDWRMSCLPFIDSRGCNYGHGGFTSNPNSILRFAQDPSYIPRAQPVAISSDQLKSYTGFFFFDYLPGILDSHKLDPEELLAQLKDDPSCPEIRDFA